MLQIENLVSAPVAARVVRHELVIVPDLDLDRTHCDTHAAARSHRSRVPVSLHSHTAPAIDDDRIENFAQRKPSSGKGDRAVRS